MDTQDSVTLTGLTEEEMKAVQDSWTKLASSWKKTGVEFFIRLFQKYPVTKTFFKTFNGMSIEEIRTAPKMRAHAANFKLGMTSFVDNLDDMDCLIVLLQKLTANHFRRQIKAEQFQDAFTLFVELAREVSDINEFTANSWKKTLNIVAKVIAEHMTTLEQKMDGE
ncbi:hemoglobin-3-like [Mercenaria mercenaria]|uniref:hemoglobin-3-like n=1 Tax=Mercenaria mercenaria TaxID=6596 RepID=UPI00234F0A3A|nr:hemoglobin-3-like [Mercenaria mercenaria]XP_053377553.1 hemoglobin-3-like [Mercenaria mercenaria]XP_053377554.1 hemoglobin-3-like [Mercenaria mercenaria]XP_053377555.1 hemoglobin-3-like [Mercenaria mercenaria]